MRRSWFTLPILILASGLLLSAANPDCVFLKDPNQFTTDVERSQKAQSDLTVRISMHLAGGADATVQTLDAVTVPRKNFIDDIIFGTMGAAGIRSAPIASDIEYL